MKNTKEIHRLAVKLLGHEIQFNEELFTEELFFEEGEPYVEELFVEELFAEELSGGEAYIVETFSPVESDLNTLPN